MYIIGGAQTHERTHISGVVELNPDVKNHVSTTSISDIKHEYVGGDVPRGRKAKASLMTAKLGS